MPYPLEKPRPASRVNAVLMLAAIAIILLVRKTDSFTNPQFWAEDGTVFFLDQYYQGASALFQPYAGYLHMVPRLIALFTDTFFPYYAAPYVYNYSSLLLTLLVCLSIFTKRLDVGRKPVLALSIVLVPHYSGEVFINITNLQWILAILLVITLLKEAPGKEYGNVKLQWALDFAIILFCGLTGPFIVLLAPFFAWKCFIKRSGYALGILLAAIAAASVQIFLIISDSISSPRGETTYRIYDYSAVVGRRLFGNLFLGITLPYGMNPFILTGLFVCLIFFLLYLAAYGDKSGRFKVAVLLGFMSFVLLATLNKFKANPLMLIPPGNAPRYFYLVYVMTVWALIVFIENKDAWKRYLVKALLSAALISSMTSGFHSKPFIDCHWSYYSGLIGKQQYLRIPLNPEGMHLDISQNR